MTIVKQLDVNPAVSQSQQQLQRLQEWEEEEEEEKSASADHALAFTAITAL